MTKTLILLAAVGVLAGCATSDTVSPTHYWKGDSTATTASYLRHNAACQDSTGFSGSGGSDSDTFQAYRSCMMTAGYTLETSDGRE